MTFAIFSKHQVGASFSEYLYIPAFFVIYDCILLFERMGKEASECSVQRVAHVSLLSKCWSTYSVFALHTFNYSFH